MESKKEIEIYGRHEHSPFQISVLGNQMKRTVQRRHLYSLIYLLRY